MQYIFLSQLQALDIKRCISDVCKPIDIKASYTDCNISVNSIVRKHESELVLGPSNVYLMIGLLKKNNKDLIICVVPSVTLSNSNVQLLEIPSKSKTDNKNKEDDSYYNKIRLKITNRMASSSKIISLWNESVLCVLDRSYPKGKDMQTKIWNDSWGGLDGHSMIIIPEKSKHLRPVLLNENVTHSFVVSETKLGLIGKGKERKLSGVKRNRDPIIDHRDHEPVNAPNLHNLREEAISKVDGAFSINLKPNQIANAWINIKQRVKNSSHICDSVKTEVITTIASRFVMDQTWKVEDESGCFVKIQEMEVDIDQAAATFILHIDDDAKIDDNETDSFKLLEKYRTLILDDVFLKERGIYQANKIMLNHPAFMQNNRGIFGKGVTHMQTGRGAFTGLTTNNSFSSPFKLSVRENKKPDIECLKRRLWKLSLIVAKFLKTVCGSLYQRSEFELCSPDSESGTMLMNVYWGPLHPFLTLLLFAYTNDQDVYCAMEAYNNKHFGIMSVVDTNWLYSESKNDSFVMPRDHDEKFNTLSDNMYEDNKHGAPFVIWRFFDLLKRERITKDANFRWGWGCTFLKIDCLIGLTDLFVPNDLKNLRQKPTEDMFKEPIDVIVDQDFDYDAADLGEDDDLCSDGEYEKRVNEKSKHKRSNDKARHKNDSVLNNQQRAQFFPSGGGMLPLIATPCKFFFNGKVEYSNAVKKMASPFVFGQYYSVDDRNQTGESSTTRPASYEASNMAIAAVSHTLYDGVCFNREAVKKRFARWSTCYNHSQEYMTSSKRHIQRLELSCPADNSDQSSLLESLTKGLQDVVAIVCESARSFPLQDYLALRDISFAAVEGMTNASYSILSKTNDGKRRLEDFIAINASLRTYIGCFYSGRYTFYNQYRWCVRLEFGRGRPIHWPTLKYVNEELTQYDAQFKFFCGMMNFIPNSTVNNLIKNLDYSSIATLNKSMHEITHDCQACRICFSIFEKSKAVELMKTHPCTGQIREASNLIDLKSTEFLTHHQGLESTFCEFQKRAKDFVLKYASNVWIYGPAGYGKSHFGKWLIEHLFLTYGMNSVLIGATTKVSANQLCNGKTINSIFRVGKTSDFRVVLMLNARGTTQQDLVTSHINEKFPDMPSRLRFFTALYLIVDEVSTLTADWFSFIDIFLQIIRCNSTPFGGITAMLIGDSLQLEIIGYDAKVIRDARINITQSGCNFFFTASCFTTDFYMILFMTSHRFKNDWAILLQKLRRGEATESDLSYLKHNIGSLVPIQLLKICMNVNHKIVTKNDMYVKDGKLIYNSTMLTRFSRLYVKEDRIRHMEEYSDENFENLTETSQLNKNLPDDEFKLSTPIVLCTEQCQRTEYGVSAMEKVNQRSYPSTDSFICISRQQHTLPLNEKAILISLLTNHMQSNGGGFEQTLTLYIGAQVTFLNNTCGAFIATNGTGTITSMNNDTITIQPQFAAGQMVPSISMERQISESVEFEYNGKLFSGTRFQFPISVGMAKLPHAVLGLTLTDRKGIIDLTRGIKHGTVYTFLGRFPDPAYVAFLQDVTIDDFKPNENALQLDDHFRKKKNSVFPVDFNFVALPNNIFRFTTIAAVPKLPSLKSVNSSKQK